MSTCILYLSPGTDRRYFFPGKALCDLHYARFLEFVIDGFEEEITSSSVSSAYEKCKNKLEPKPGPIKPMPKPKKPTLYGSNSFKMGM